MSFTCGHCLRPFSRKDNLIKHIQVVHDPAKQKKNPFKGRIICAVCHLRFENYSSYHFHLEAKHDVNTAMTIKQFSSIQEFQNWKSNVERETFSSFLQDTAAKKLKNGAVTRYFRCHRSCAGKVKKKKAEKKLKLAGPNRVSVCCPAMIKAIITNDAVEAQYFLTHLGHDCDMSRLRLSIEEKNLLAEKLKAGVSIQRILDDIRNEDPAKLSRIHLVKKIDLRNMKTRMKFQSQPEIKDDRMNVESWICEQQGQPENPILFYKKQDTEYENFEKSDFILILMFDFQREMMRKFGNHVICVDGTRGLNADDFRLYTLLVLDEYDEGIPVAFCLSNRATTDLYKLFFSEVKKAINKTIKPFIFMSDGEMRFYNTWVEIMSEAEHQLICHWHLSKIWRTNVSKITNSEKRKLVLETLNMLMIEEDVNAFEISLIEFLHRLQEDKETHDFYLYFNENYANNVRMWAQCYRPFPFVPTRTNFNLEALRKGIKYEYLGNTRSIRLDETVHALVSSVRNKKYERWTKVAKRKPGNKLCETKKRHDRSAECNGKVEELGFENWSVQSSTNLGKYEVKLVKYSPCCAHICKECQICLHMLTCSCPDNAVEQNICKHIHAVMKFQSTSTEVFILSPAEFQNSVFYPAAELNDSSELADQSEMKSGLKARIAEIMRLFEDAVLTEDVYSQCMTHMDLMSEILSECTRR